MTKANEEAVRNSDDTNKAAMLRAAVTLRGATANRRWQRLLLKAGEVRKNEFEVDRAVNFHHFSSC